MIELEGYTDLTTIYDGSRSVVLRGKRVRDNTPVIIKLLKTEHPSIQDILNFKQQYEVTCNLELDGVVRIYALESYRNSPALVLEDFGGVSLKSTMTSRPLPILDFLKLAVRLADILGQVHSKNIIHKDIKPQNILINPTNGEVKLTDFGIATTLPQEQQRLSNAGQLEGTIAYISPEQTGRMNRAVDYRSDLYSLGITLYEILTGTLPFKSHNPLELVHAQIAVAPSPPCAIRPEIPRVLSDIVMKLLAKTAEDRYQSAHGLKADLERCLSEFRDTGTVAEFEIGRHNVTDKFQISQKLYGREREVELLMAAFRKANQGGASMLLIAGYSGVGKSSLINEVYKPIARGGGLFISGKFDQYKRDVPYDAVIQAFQELVRQILTQSDQEISVWKARLRDALGRNGAIVTEVIPEMEFIIGKQKPVPDLPPDQSQNRFNLVMQAFVSVFCYEGHPLVLFLDDLQWADGASLKLLELLITDLSANHLLILGAYRDNEVDASHLLTVTLNDIHKTGADITTVSLAPLELGDLNQLLADTLYRDLETTGRLAELVHQKTGGNPFFVNEFLKSLYRDGMLEFDLNEALWRWDLAQIQASNITDNVAELMQRTIRRVPAETREALRMAACLGNHFDAQVVAKITGASPATTVKTLEKAIEQGLIIPLTDGYKYVALDQQALSQPHDLAEIKAPFKFAHDRVQQAAYSLIAPGERPEVHLRIGRILMDSLTKTEREEKLFAIVNHLNFGHSLLDAERDRLDLAHLNLRAGKRAKLSNAHESSLRHFETGIALLPADSWASHYDLSSALYMEKAEAEFLNGHLEEADIIFKMITDKLKTKIEQARVYCLHVDLYMVLGRPADALRVGLDGLKLFGTKLAPGPKSLNVLLGLLKWRHKLKKVGAQHFLHLPKMTDPETEVKLSLYTRTATAGYFVDQDYLVLASLCMLELAYSHGETAASSITVVTWGMMNTLALGDYQRGDEFGEVGLQLSKRYKDQAIRSKVIGIYSFLIRIWCHPIRESLDLMKEGFRYGYEGGDLQWAGYNSAQYGLNIVVLGWNIDAIMEEMEKYDGFAYRAHDEFCIDVNRIRNLFLRNIRGDLDDPLTFNDDTFDENTFLSNVTPRNSERSAVYYYLFKGQLAYLRGAYEQAQVHAEEVEKRLDLLAGQSVLHEHAFYYALSLAALYPEQTAGEQRKSRRLIDKQLKKLRKWAAYCPANCLHKVLLVEAEMAAANGLQHDAMEKYEQAIQSAREQEFIHHEALANLLAATCCTRAGLHTSAKAYLVNARYGLERWGAQSLVNDLNDKYADLLPQDEVHRPTAPVFETATKTTEEISDRLDLDAMMRASQTISGEGVLGELLEKIMRIAMQNAGAERGFLILERDGSLTVESEGTVNPDHVTVLQSIRVDEKKDLCTSLIQYVLRTKESVVLADATREGLFTEDPYIIQAKPKSILCVPIIFQGKLKGILYLENNLAVGVFTPERLEVLRVLSGQAAMAINQASASIDTLTRAWVRRYFMERASETLEQSRRSGAPLCLLMIDLDHFKQKNDTYGHLAGDAVLRETAGRLRGALRDEDFFGRFGGEEFILLLPNTSRDEGMAIAERLRSAVGSRPIHAQGEQVQQTISIGLVHDNGTSTDLDQLIREADNALYKAKRDGRDRVIAA